MQVSLDNSTDYDKKIIYIESSSGIFSDDNFNFYIDMTEPIKNIVFIRIMNIQIVTNQLYLSDDVFYIELNDYERAVSYMKTENDNDNDYLNTRKYFEIIQLSEEPIDGNKYVSRIIYPVGWVNWSDPAVYVLNPPEPSLKRFNITIRDKNYNIVNRNLIHSFKLTICVYNIKKNVIHT